MVPGKSVASRWRTGHVWHPMGRPRGVARSCRATRETRPAAAAFVDEYLRNSLLEMAGIDSSLFTPRLRGDCTPGDGEAHNCSPESATKGEIEELSDVSLAGPIY